MKTKRIALFLIGILFIFFAIAYVQPCYAERADGRYACQQDVRMDLEKAQKAVRHGIQTKQINQQEAEGIRQNLRRVENDFNRALSDGKLNPKECERLQSETRSLYRHIKQNVSDDDDQKSRWEQACHHKIRNDLEKARIIVRDGVDAKKINERESVVIHKKIEALENDLNTSLSDGGLNSRECYRLKHKINDLYNLIGYARNK